MRRQFSKKTLVCGVALAAMLLLSACQSISLPFINGQRTPMPLAVVENTSPARNARASRNWSGYEIVHTGITAISATWQVPAVTGPPNSDSSTWIGVGGDRSPTLIQAGTDQLVQQGKSFYYAWIEMLPDPPIQITSIQVLPGDTMTFSLTQTGTQTWTLSIIDHDAHLSLTKTLTYASCGCSAEWIEEAPSVNHAETILANFASVTFTACTTVIDNHTTCLNLAKPIRMTDTLGRTLAQPQIPQGASFAIVDISPQLTGRARSFDR